MRHLVSILSDFLQNPNGIPTVLCKNPTCVYVPRQPIFCQPIQKIKIMYKYFITMLILSINAFATDTYVPATSTLNLDNVIVGGTQYNNVVLDITGYKVISVGSSTPVNTSGGGVSATCSASNFTTANFNAIAIGMTINKVAQTIGCNYDPSMNSATGSVFMNTWNYFNGSSLMTITVFFDSGDNIVTAIGSTFKTRNGF